MRRVWRNCDQKNHSSDPLSWEKIVQALGQNIQLSSLPVSSVQPFLLFQEAKVWPLANNSIALLYCNCMSHNMQLRVRILCNWEIPGGHCSADVSPSYNRGNVDIPSVRAKKTYNKSLIIFHTCLLKGYEQLRWWHKYINVEFQTLVISPIFFQYEIKMTHNTHRIWWQIKRSL